MRLELAPISLADAREFVAYHHRHSEPPRGHKFSVAARKAGEVVAVVIVGRPVSRVCDDGKTLEIVRLCTRNGAANAASFLIGAAARASWAMGYKRLITYTLKREGGASLRAAGMTVVAEVKGRQWHCESRPRRRREVEDRLRWELFA